MNPPRRQFFICMAVAAIVFVLDAVSKQIVLASSLAEEPVRILPFFRLVLVENTGAAFGLLANSGPAARIFLICVSIAVAAALALHLWLSQPPKQEALGCALVLGGAAGNLADRILRGKVADFLDFHIKQWHWPAFNIADSAITIGATLLIFSILFQNKSKML